MQYLFPILQWKLSIVCSPQVTDKDQEFATGPAKQLEYQQFEDDKLSQKSSSSKLSRSPLKIVKKPKSMQCKVILLDGSEYTCDVEVSVYLKYFFCPRYWELGHIGLKHAGCLFVFPDLRKITQTQFLNTKLFPVSLTGHQITENTCPQNVTI